MSLTLTYTYQYSWAGEEGKVHITRVTWEMWRYDFRPGTLCMKPTLALWYGLEPINLCKKCLKIYEMEVKEWN